MDAWTRLADRVVLALALVLLVAGAAGGPGWLAASSDAVLATQLERTASAPLFGLLASVAGTLPVGEPGFRVALLAAVLGAFVLVGVLRAARALLPRDPVAGAVSVALLALAPPFRDVAGFAGPSTLAACGAVWCLVFAVEHARVPSARHAVAAIACAGLVIGAAPWLGTVGLLALLGWLARTTSRPVLVGAVGVLGAVAVMLWIGALGRLPDPAPGLAALVTATGRGATAVLLGAGLLGVGFATATGLPAARTLALAVLLAAVHAIVVDHDPTVLLALLAVGCAVIPSAVVRVVPRRRHLVAAIAGIPLVGAALLAGPATGVDDPGAAPAQLATDLADALPAGPGVFVASRPTTFAALEYAQLVAGARPDLVVVSPLSAATNDVIVANALRTGRIAGADLFAFGRLDPRRAYPRGRGFELLGREPTKLAPIRPPAGYASALGQAEATLLALALARYEGGFGRLDAAAHAAGLTARFGAADLAILATSVPSRPALFGFVPRFDTPTGPWMLELLGDDLAWVAGLDVPGVDGEEVEAPPARKLHALWRKLINGAITPEDPAIAALGPRAVTATQKLVAALAKP